MQAITAPQAQATRQDATPTREPIAIIGIGCRYPGDANGPDGFWRLVRDGIDAITEAPAERWHSQAFYDDDPSAPGKMYSRWGGFLPDVDQFDAPFFAISRLEAARMDPQQRLLLEVAWEAFEDAGLPTTKLAGSKTGVFIGVSRNDYGEIQLNPTERDKLNAYSILGLASCMLANRLSYVFDLRGPSFPVDTACSSSLVAVSLACQSIWQGESAMALAGGVNLIFKPEVMIGMSKAFLLAADGRCKSFDATADGYARCEGAGLVVLKPLSQAQAAGDAIYAVIRGCAVNYDGYGDEITVPNGTAQQAALLSACTQAGIAPYQIQYIEAQGTGSLIGDAVEANALGTLIGAGRPAEDPIYIGSVKSNIGHAEAAAGVSSLIKAALALNHRQIPPSLHFHTPNPKIPFATLGLQVAQQLQPWPTPADGALRYASVNAFGIGGTNAHVVLSEAPLPAPGPDATPKQADDYYLFPLSARSPQALHTLAERLLHFLHESTDTVTLADLCYSASVHRSHHAQRVAWLVASKTDLGERLRAYCAGEEEPESPAAVAPALVELRQRYLAGETVAFSVLYPAGGGFTRLPIYPWQHKRYWHESEEGLATRRGEPSPTDGNGSAPTAPSAPTTVAATASPTVVGQGSPLLQQLVQGHDPRQQLAAYITELVADILDLEPAAVAPDQGFFEMGFSSLQAIELRNRLNQSLGVTLHPTATFKYPTLTALVDYLATAVLPKPPTAPARQPGGAEQSEQPQSAAANHITEPIAIIGLGCRFPGADSPAAFWSLLANGQDAVSEAPPERWAVERYYDPDPEQPGKMYTRAGGFLAQIDRFDPQFFGISPREAEEMDPHQWLLLEVCWEALEQAGIAPDQLRHHLTGVFIGMCADDHLQLSGATATTEIGPYSVLGNARSVAAGRIAYILGAQGPAIQLDTACSSSLVALHYACQSLRLGEADLALAGGVNLMLTPRNTISLCQMKALAPDGRCKTFDATADGYGRGEGCGVVVLKRYTDAVRDGDSILALVCASAVNHDGPSSGLTVPNEQAQERLLRQTLRLAGVAPAAVSYIETHGTGTPLGDPIEVNAIGTVFGDRQEPLMLGAVKSNIGHLEAAAGIASVIKVVLALQHQQLPPQLHLRTPNPDIPWERLPLRIPDQLLPWTGEQRLAGCSAFGFSGTNAHVLLQAAPTQRPATADDNTLERPLHLLTLSAKTPAALHQLATTYAAALAAQPEGITALADIAFTANTGRAHFRRRMALTVTTTADAVASLRAYASGQTLPTVQIGELRPGQQPKVAFLFTGQGAQMAGMGRDLYATQPTFRHVLAQCDEILRPLLGESILAVMFGAEPESGGQPDRKAERPEGNKGARSSQSKINETAYAQPALFALAYALAKLWQSWGVEPAAVMGHSVGEYVAACLAGAFSLEEGLRLVARRGQLMQALPQAGEMAAIFAPEAQVAAAVVPYAAQVAIAALNGPQNTVISGAGQAVRAVVATLEAQGVDAKLLQVSHAFHSPLLDPMLAEFEQLASQQTFAPLRLPLVSNLTGTWLAPGTQVNAQYWRDHTRNPVRFAAGIEALLAQGYTHFLEIGPRPVLTALGRQIAEPGSAKTEWLPSLKSGEAAWQTLLQSVATLYTHGLAIDWAGFDRDYRRQRVVLPTYPFQRTFQRKPYQHEGERQTMNGHTTMQTINRQPARYEQLAHGLQTIVGDTLKLDPTLIEVDIPLIELGADSLTLVNAVRTIESAYGVKISVRQFFEELSTVTALATYLDQQLPASWGQGAVSNGAGQNGLTPHGAASASMAAPSAAPQVADTYGAMAWSPQSQPVVLPPSTVPPIALQPPAPQPALMPAATPAAYLPAAPAANAGERERVINSQLQLLGQLMTQQLNLLQTPMVAPTAPSALTPPYQEPVPPSPMANGALRNDHTNGHANGHTNGHAQAYSPTPAAVAPVPPAPMAPPTPPAAPKAQPQALGPWRPAQTQKSALNPQQQAHLDALITRYNQRTHSSKALTQRYRAVLADSRVAVGFRASIKEMIYPIMGERAQGAHFWDVDGNEYIDMTMGFGTLLFGHTPPFLQDALQAQHQLGVEIGPQIKLTGEVAELVAELTGMERVTFCNSGTEAIMAAIRLARAATGRTKILYFSGSYHGHSDMTLGTATDGNADPRAMTFFPGISPSILADALVVEYGNMESLEIIRAHAHELAAVLVEPIQSRRPELQPVEFVRALRQLTAETGIVLIFDEMVTGFRIHPGGAQAWFGVKADLAAYGKIAGGGMPIGIIAGKASIMNYIDGGVWQYGDDSHPSKETVFFGGTFCKHPLAMATAKASLLHIKAIGTAAYDQLNQRTANFAETLNRYFEAEQLPIRVVYWGSLFLFRFQSNLEVFFFHLLEKGIFMWEWRNCFLSMAHTDEDIAYLIQAVKATIEELRNGAFLAVAPGGNSAPRGGIDAPIGASALKVTGKPQAAPAKSPMPAPVQPAQQCRAVTQQMEFSFYYFGLYDAAYAPGKYDLLFAGARYADDHGFRALWVPERHFHEFGGFSPNPSVLCAALAHATTRIGLRAGSVVLPIHHPVRVVEEWAVVDNLSNGRVGLGLASGWHPNDFIFAPDTFGKHRDLTFESIATIRHLWQGKTLTYRNGAGHATPVQIFPMPVQRTVPLYLTIVNNPDTFAKAGELGVGILTNLMAMSVEELAQNIARYRAARAAAGYDPLTGEVVVLMHTFVSEDLLHARAVARRPLCEYFRSTISLFKSMAENMGVQNDFDQLSPTQQDDFLALVYDRYVVDRALIGTPESCTAVVEQLHTIGVTEIACFVDFGIEGSTVQAHFPQVNALRERCQVENSPPKEEAPALFTRAASFQEKAAAAVIQATSSAAQQQLWLLAQLGATESLAYNEFITLTLHGTLHVPALQQALAQVLHRHEALRTIFSEDGSAQLIQPATVVLSMLDYSQLPAAERTAVVARWLQEEGGRAFDLRQGPLFTAHLLRLGATAHLLALKAHHTVFDGWSFGVLLEELSALYNAAYGGLTLTLPPALPFRSFVQTQRDHRDSTAMQRHEAYWLAQFTTLPPLLDLPTERPRPVQPTYVAARHSLTLTPALVTALKGVSRAQRATLFMTLFATYTTLLHRLTGQDNFVVGTPVSGRFTQESERMIGYGTHLLPIRATIDPAATFANHLATTRRCILDGFEHEAYPFAWLIEELHARGEGRTTGLIRTTFNMDQPLVLPTWHGLETAVDWQPRQAAPFELVLNAIESDGALRLDCDYNTDLFTAATITRWLGHFQTLLESIVADAAQPLAMLPLLTAAERQQLLTLWQTSAEGAPVAQEHGHCLHEWFAAQAAQTPDAIALTCAGQQMTYRALNERANQLAHHLQSLGVGPNTPVGLCLERSLEMVIGLLGILKAGGAYLPLDPMYPAARLTWMVEDAQPVALVTQGHLAAHIPAASLPLICLDHDAAQLDQYPTHNPISTVTPADLAYIIYTSGSTGQPKGTLIHHDNVARLFTATAAWFHFQAADVWTLFHSIAFDFSVWEVWGALLYGGRLVIVPYAVSRSPEEFYSLLIQERVTVLNQTPSAFRQLLTVDATAKGEQTLALRYVIFGGEALELQSLRPWFATHGDQTPQLVNMYGITETTVHVTYRPLTCADLAGTASVIGQPIPDLQLYLLDKGQQPVPIGIPGEIYVGGAGVGHGYLKRPELTAERFISNPFGAGRLYRSGDLARYQLTADGKLEVEYLGRIDHQVKIRGFRIELGEIEAVLNQHPAVRESVVLVQGDQPEQKRLVAYVAARTEESEQNTASEANGSRHSSASGLRSQEMRDYLKQRLPDYMVPATFVWVEALPLTDNGKVDRRALTQMTVVDQAPTEPVTPPTTPTEATVVDIWAEVLPGLGNGAAGIGIHHNFFDLGGQSLLVGQVAARINKTFGIELPMRTLFESPTVVALAASIDLLKTAQRLQMAPAGTLPSDTKREEILL